MEKKKKRKKNNTKKKDELEEEKEGWQKDGDIQIAHTELLQLEVSRLYSLFIQRKTIINTMKCLHICLYSEFYGD